LDAPHDCIDLEVFTIHDYLVTKPRSTTNPRESEPLDGIRMDRKPTFTYNFFESRIIAPDFIDPETHKT
jgi:hypothetical protein